MSDNEITAPAIKEIAKLASAAAPVLYSLPDAQTGVMVPDGYHLEKLREKHPQPTDIAIHNTFTEAESFNDYINRFKSDATQLFADIEITKVVAVIDYHKSDSTPAKCLHKAALKVKLSDQWKAWSKIDGQYIPQQAFAEFIEENSIDITNPDGATLLEMVTHLKAHKNVEFQSGTNLQNGEIQFTYHEEVKNQTGGRKGEITIPDKIELTLPVFFKGEFYKLQAFLRYRIADQNLLFKIDLHRADHVLCDAFDNVLQNIESATDITPYHADI